MLQATKSWAGPGNEATWFPTECTVPCRVHGSVQGAWFPTECIVPCRACGSLWGVWFPAGCLALTEPYSHPHPQWIDHITLIDAVKCFFIFFFFFLNF